MVDISLVNEKYVLQKQIKRVISIPGYPHVLEGVCEEPVIIKILEEDMQKISLMNEVYINLRNIGEILSPIFNVDLKPITLLKFGVNIVVFEKIDNLETQPEPDWWGRVLAKIHSVKIFNEVQEIESCVWIKEAHNYISAVSQYMENDIKKILTSMLNELSFLVEKKVVCVLNHGDPANYNVLKCKNQYKLIDFESVKIAPCEYDLQRKLWDHAVYSSDTKNYYVYLEKLLAGYTAVAPQNSIDFEVLASLYVTDFCKTLCWLYLVSVDENREDKYRQKCEKDIIVFALREGRVHLMLELLMKRGML